MIPFRTVGFDDFEVTIPESWVYKHDKNVVIFISNDNKFNLTISINKYDKNISKNDEGIFNEYLHARLKAEKEAAKNEIIISPIKINKENHYIYTKYNGVEKKLNRNFACLITAENGEIITLYIESINVDQKDFLLLSNKIIESLKTK